MRVGVVVLPNVADGALGLTLDVLRWADTLAQRTTAEPAFDVELLSTGPDIPRTDSGHPVHTESRLGRAEHCHWLIVPGFMVRTEDELERYLEAPGTRDAVRGIRAARARGSCLAAACTATFLLAEAGALEGRRATTTWWLADAFRRRYPNVELRPDAMLTEAGGVLCGAAGTAHAELAISLVRIVTTPDVAEGVARTLLVDRRVSQWTHRGSAANWGTSDFAERAEAWVRRKLAGPFTMPELARGVGVSHRTLVRRLCEGTGRSPQRFVQTIRLEVAMQLLETTDLTIGEVARRVGHSDATQLRRVFRRQQGTTPSEYRRRARALAAAGAAER
ncbi:MAG: helix-turn-helix domain-containing protein [Myxococcota bacterium]